MKNMLFFSVFHLSLVIYIITDVKYTVNEKLFIHYAITETKLEHNQLS